MGQLRGQRAGPGPLSPGGGKGSLTEEAGQDPHVCRVGVGTGWKQTGAGAGRRGPPTQEGGLPEAPWTRGGAGGGWTLCRRKRGCRGGSRGQERGGEGAGRRLRPGEEGGGRREGGCPTADTHTGDSRLARSAVLRLGGRQASGEDPDGVLGQSAHPSAASPVPPGLCAGSRGIEDGLTSAAGVGDLVQHIGPLYLPWQAPVLILGMKPRRQGCG